MTRAAYLGVDAGNSKTDALVCDAAGHALGHGRGGCGDIYGCATPADAVRAVAAAVSDALDSAGVAPVEIASAAYRLAGVDWPEDHAFWVRATADQLGSATTISIANDGFAAIRAGESSGQGVGLALGTGPAIAARGPAGETSLSFWIQDPLGASGMGRDALAAAYRQVMGTGEETALTAALLDHYQVRTVEDLLHRFTRREGGAPWQAMASAGSLVAAAADGTDPVAVRIVDTHAGNAARYVQVAASRSGYGRDAAITIVLAGSVLRAPRSPMVVAVTRALRDQLPHARVRVAPLPPVAGAALDALAAAGLPVADATSALLATARPCAPGAPGPGTSPPGSK